MKDSNMIANADNDLQLQDYFNLLDKDNNGIISFADFASLFINHFSP
jgi:Ca2+-binding EF-hand superfamily protein